MCNSYRWEKKWKLYLQGANHINRTLQVQQHRAVFHYDHCFSAQQSALIEKWKWKAYWNILQVRQHWPALQKFSHPPKTPFRDHFGTAWKTWENVFSRYNNTEMWVTCTATWVNPQWNYFWWQFFVCHSQLWGKKWKWKVYKNILQVQQHWTVGDLPLFSLFTLFVFTFLESISRCNNTELWVTCTATSLNLVPITLNPHITTLGLHNSQVKSWIQFTMHITIHNIHHHPWSSQFSGDWQNRET